MDLSTTGFLLVSGECSSSYIVLGKGGEGYQRVQMRKPSWKYQCWSLSITTKKNIMGGIEMPLQHSANKAMWREIIFHWWCEIPWSVLASEAFHLIGERALLPNGQSFIYSWLFLTTFIGLNPKQARLSWCSPRLRQLAKFQLPCSRRDC